MSEEADLEWKKLNAAAKSFLFDAAGVVYAGHGRPKKQHMEAVKQLLEHRPELLEEAKAQKQPKKPKEPRVMQVCGFVGMCVPKRHDSCSPAAIPAARRLALALARRRAERALDARRCPIVKQETTAEDDGEEKPAKRKRAAAAKEDDAAAAAAPKVGGALEVGRRISSKQQRVACLGARSSCFVLVDRPCSPPAAAAAP